MERDEHIQQRDCRWRDGVHKGARLTSSGGNLAERPLETSPCLTLNRGVDVASQELLHHKRRLIYTTTTILH